MNDLVTSREAPRRDFIKAAAGVLSAAAFHGYAAGSDTIRVPEQESFFEPINFYRTALHELTHYAEVRIMPRECKKGLSHVGWSRLQSA